MGYDEQLDRAMAEKSEIDADESRFDVPDPNVRTEGNFTVYENFPATLDRLDREQRHVLQFIQNDLGTAAQIDENGRARLTGEFDADRIAEALDDYVERYVRCPECGLPDTNLVEEGDTTHLQCDACGARTTV
ncbi:translation initiation factor 2 subunit 2 [Halarchaeum rubridurum]|uniref:Translation initiation factor 2 subunit 2 n=1 Tax=Halarchaeum rubridurum TaxID=489911 RepID=A0A830FV25_9EURY|nr:translation initiation factor IF-2 subunit beta [Halarchaeum rubridurum]MBP1953645.1 translation initiation factor 2 subunit 2 [Halarchaeum rubridurum]GGM63724.1 translation initiation factor 2 subunit beta [Halarchaeum rubridurum]